MKKTYNNKTRSFFELFEFQKSQSYTETPDDKTRLQRQIDQLVYELYGLKEEEVRIVEEVAKK